MKNSTISGAPGFTTTAERVSARHDGDLKRREAAKMMGYPINIPQIGVQSLEICGATARCNRPKNTKTDLQQNAVQLYAKARNRPWRREVEPCLKTWAKRIGVTEPTLVKSGEFTWANTDHWGWLTTVFITFKRIPFLQSTMRRLVLFSDFYHLLSHSLNFKFPAEFNVTQAQYFFFSLIWESP